MKRVHLRIDRLVLRGVRLDDPGGFSSELRRELERIAGGSDGSAPASGIDAQARRFHIEVSPRANAGTVGRRVARALGGAIPS